MDFLCIGNISFCAEIIHAYENNNRVPKNEKLEKYDRFEIKKNVAIYWPILLLFLKHFSSL